MSPGNAGREVEGVRVRRPGENVNAFIPCGHREGFTSRRRDEIKLRRPVTGIVTRIIPVFSLGKKCDPAAIGGPLRRIVVTGLCQLRERAGAPIAIEPKVVAIDALAPIRALSLKYERVPVGRKLQVGYIDRIKEFVERQLGFVSGMGESCDEEQHRAKTVSV